MENDELLSEEVLQMSLRWENYDKITEIIQTAEPEERQAMLTQLAYHNPYLSAKIVMETSSNNQKEEKEELLRVINKRLAKVINSLSRKLLLLALLELEENEQFWFVDKSNVDFSEKKTIRYFLDRLNLKQRLTLIQFFATYQEGVHVRIAMNMVLHQWQDEISPEEKESSVDTAKVLIQNGKPGDAYRLLQAIEVDRDFSQVLGISEEELLQSVESRSPFLTVNEAGFLCNLKYGLRAETADSKGVWDAICQGTQEITDISINGLIKRYVKRGVFSDETLLHILKLRGFSDESCMKCLSDRSCVLTLLSPSHKECVYKEPFYSLLEDEKKIMELLEDETFDNDYRFSEKRLDKATNKGVVTEEREYFDRCTKNYSSAKNLVRVYFNTPLKYVVNLEYLIETIIKRFDYSETDLRYLLRGYTFKGKVCRVNENSVSIRAYNVWTCLPCRLGNQKCRRDKQLPEKGEIIYFKFDYLAVGSRKINVCLPVASLEEMRELEAHSPDFSD